jgi:hypothetical protein
MYITTPSVNPVDEFTTDNVDSSTGFTGGIVIYITDY